MSSLPELYDQNASSEERARLSEVVAQTDLQGRQLTKTKSEASCFSRLCKALFPCFAKNRHSKAIPYSQLPVKLPQFHGKNTLVLDLDETLVHSSFVPTSAYDFIIPVELENSVNYAYVAKRPGVDEFLEKSMAAFEVVIFTASMKIYADPLIDRLVQNGRVHKLFRHSCRYINGIYVKDLTRLGRSLESTVIVDVRLMQNSPSSYALQPQNAVAIKSWYSDTKDNDLVAVWKILEKLIDVDDIPKALNYAKKDLDSTVDLSNANKSAVELERAGFNSPVVNRGPLSFSMATA